VGKKRKDVCICLGKDKKVERKKRDKYDTCICLTEEQVDFLNDISGRCRCSGGKKLSRTAIVRALLTAIRELDINAKTIKDEKQLESKIIGAFWKYK